VSGKIKLKNTSSILLVIMVICLMLVHILVFAEGNNQDSLSTSEKENITNDTIKLHNNIQKNNYTEEKEKHWMELSDKSNYVVQGIVIDKTSFWYNTTKHNQIYTKIILNVTEYKKGIEGKEQKTLEIIYDGGIVGKYETILITYPGGIVSTKMGETITCYMNEKTLLGDKFYATAIRHDSYEVPEITQLKSSQDPCDKIDVQEHQLCGFEYLGVHFHENQMPIQYKVNSNTDDITGEAYQIVLGFDEWENISTSYLAFDYDGDTSITAMSPLDDSAILWRDDQSSSFIARCWTHNLLVEAYGFDIEFNDYYTWTNDTFVSGSQYPIKLVQCHEAGHVLQILDLCNPDLKDDSKRETMYYTANSGDASLEDGELDAATYLYPIYPPPNVTINSPSNNFEFNNSFTLSVTVSCPQNQTIEEVQYMLATKNVYSISHGWFSLTSQGNGVYTANVNPSQYYDQGDYWLTVRVRTDEGMLNYNAITVTYKTWKENWDYRKSFKVFGNTGTDVNNYPIKIRIYKGTGDDYGSIVYIDTWKVQSDFDDIRFCKNIGTNQELDYWMLYKSASYADFWIEVPQVDRLNTLLPEDSERQSTTLLIYYGNSTVTDGCDGANTFREFDNLENYAVNTYLPLGDWIAEDVDEEVKITGTYSYEGSKAIYCYDDSSSGRNFFYWDITDLTSTTKSYRFHVAAYVTSSVFR